MQNSAVLERHACSQEIVRKMHKNIDWGLDNFQNKKICNKKMLFNLLLPLHLSNGSDADRQIELHPRTEQLFQLKIHRVHQRQKERPE